MLRYMNKETRRQKTENRKRKVFFKIAYRAICKFCLLFSIVCLPSYIYAEDTQQVTAEASFDKEAITIGEKVKYTITIDAPQGAKIDFPVIDPTLTSTGFAIRDFGEEKPVKAKRNRIKIKKWYLLDTYIVGSYNVPAIVINYTLPDGTTGSAQTKDIFLEVKSVIKEGEKTEDIRDIKGPAVIKVNYKKIILWSIIILIFLAISITAPFIYMKYKRIKLESMPLIPPHIIALKELEKIKAMKLDTPELIKAYHIAISGVVRHYIENRFSIHAPERTTEEFLSELTQTNVLSQTFKGLLRDFLKQCDMVKFAKYGPSQEEIENVYNTAKKFIEETIPQYEIP